MPRLLAFRPALQHAGGALTAQRALLHPAWLAALVVLALNDHVIKGSGLLPEILTGKLSDVAGMFVAPALLATSLRVHTRLGWWLAHAAVGMVFASIKFSAACAAAWSTMMSAFGFAWTIVVDPTDVLVALPALLVAGHVLYGALGTPSVRLARRSAEAGAAGIGLLCAVATSPPPPEVEPWEEQWLPEIFADVWLHNGTGTSQVVRIRTLRASVELDCDAVEADPARLLPEVLFGEVSSWTLPDNANLQVLDPDLAVGGGCNAARVDADAFAPVVLFWRTGSPSANWVPGNGFDNGFTGGIALSLDGDDRGHYDDTAGVLFTPSETTEPTPECSPQDDGLRVDWGDAVPQGSFELVGLTAGVDGCTAIDLGLVDDESSITRRMYLCTPPLNLPFTVGDEVAVRMEYGVQSESVVIERTELPSKRLVVSRGASAPVVSGLQIALVPLYGCELEVDDCGTAARAASLTIGGGNYPTAQTAIGGAPTVLEGDDGTRITVAVAHAQQRSVLDTECAAGPTALGDDLELAIVIEEPGA